MNMKIHFRSLALSVVMPQSTATASDIKTSTSQAQRRTLKSSLVVERIHHVADKAKTAAIIGTAITAMMIRRFIRVLANSRDNAPKLKGRRTAPFPYSAFCSGFDMAMVSPASPTLNRAKRFTEMFSPSLPILLAMTCEIEMVWSLIKGCSYKQTSS